MDTQQLIDETRSRFKHQESKLYLEEKYTSQLIFTNQGGSWTASTTIISYLKSAESTVIMLDNFKNPLKVDSKELLVVMESVYNSVMNSWYEEFQKLQRYR